MASLLDFFGRRSAGPLLPQNYQTVAPVREVMMPLIFVYATLLPAGLALEISSLIIPPYRLAALAITPFAMFQLIQRRISLSLPDILIVAGGAWALIAMLFTSTFLEGLEGGGSFVVDMLGGYFIGRAYITDTRKLRSLLIFCLPGMLAIAAILAIEAISHQLLIAPLFPQRASLANLYEVRLGLLRARAVFPHSIAAGIFMASLLSLYYTLGVDVRKQLLGVIAAIAAVFSGSSSAYLMLLMLVFLMSYKGFFNTLLARREQFSYLVIAFVALLFFLEVATQRGAIRTLINILAINPQSGYYRLLIWEYGTQAVANNPWFGIGNAPMPRPSWMIAETIDNHWLTLAVRYGLPTAFLIGAGVIASIYLCVSRNVRLNDFDRTTTLGAVFALLALSVIAWVVALWANHVAWYMLLVGAVASMSNQLPKTVARPSGPSQGRRHAIKPISQRRSA